MTAIMVASPMPSKTTRVPSNRCPVCKYQMDAATGVEPETKPKPGDVSICWQCGAVLIFDTDLTSRLPTEQEFKELRESPMWPTVRKGVALAHRRRQLLKGRDN